MAHVPPDTSDDGDHDDLAALDFSVNRNDAGETELAAILGEYESQAIGDAPEPWDAPEPFTDDLVDQEVGIPMFTIANPPGTVTVTTLMDGRVHQIDLSPGAVTMTEAVLAEEIVVISGLATQDARSAQFTYILEGMRVHGHDTVGTRDFLNRELDLPTPEQAQAARAEVFATRYQGDE